MEETANKWTEVDGPDEKVEVDWKEIEEGLVYELSGRALELARCFEDIGRKVHPVESLGKYARRLAGRAVRLADLFEEQIRIQRDIETAEKALARARSAKRRRKP